MNGIMTSAISIIAKSMIGAFVLNINAVMIKRFALTETNKGANHERRRF